MKYKQIISATFRPMYHNGVQISALRWLPKTGQYVFTANGRDQRVTKEITNQAQDQISEYLARHLVQANKDFRVGKINMEQWKLRLHKVIFVRLFLHDFVCNGGLDSENHSTALNDTKAPELEAKRKILLRQDIQYVEDLAALILRGAFGHDLSFGRFDDRVMALLATNKFAGDKNISSKDAQELVK